nr:MAG TPA: hypothetical protein [Caudoviricetes sp.]
MQNKCNHCNPSSYITPAYIYIILYIPLKIRNIIYYNKCYITLHRVTLWVTLCKKVSLKV